jgi:SGNH domain (fused to AT3 domains)
MGVGLRSYFFQQFFFEDNKAKALFVDTLRMLKTLGVSVVIISPTPIFADTLRCIKQKFRKNASTDTCDYDVESISNKNTFDIISGLASVEKVKYIDLRELVCPEGICHASRSGVLYFRDSYHLSNESVSMVASFIHDKLNAD